MAQYDFMHRCISLFPREQSSGRRKTMKKTVPSFFGCKQIATDPSYESLFIEHLRTTFSADERHHIYKKFSGGATGFDAMMRKILIKSLLKKAGNDLVIAPGVSFAHPETIEIGNGVFIGESAIIQGRKDGTCIIGNKVWIGPQSFLDARNLSIGNYVGWGPGAKVLGSEHADDHPDKPIIASDLIIRPVQIGDNCDIGINAVILPGVEIGNGCIVGAGAVVTKSVASNHVVAGVPAKIIRRRG